MDHPRNRSPAVAGTLRPMFGIAAEMTGRGGATLATEAAHGEISRTVSVVVGIVAIACVVGVLTKFVRVPYTVALVLVGLAAAAIEATPTGVLISEELVLLVFLPPLLFQAGLHIDLGLLQRAWLPVALLAVPGVLLTTVLVAMAIRPFLVGELGEAGATWTAALLLGIVLAPTDPISVVATYKSAGVPKTLRTVVEGEALFNDGTAVALFAVLKTAIVAGGVAGVAAGVGEDAAHGVAEGAGQVEIGAVLSSFVFKAGVGTVLGIGLGGVAFFVLKKLEDHVLETAITIALAWGSFVLAEEMHASGVIAVVVSALIMGNYGKLFSMSDETRRTLTGFWDSMDFLVNSILFLLVGFELSDPAIGGVRGLLRADVLLAAAAVMAALLIARALTVYPVVMATKRHWPRGWKHVIWWSGLKGSLSLALILGLPEGELRRFAAAVAFLVVLMSLLGQVLTMGAFIRWVRGAEEIETGSEPAGAD